MRSATMRAPGRSVGQQRDELVGVDAEEAVGVRIARFASLTTRDRYPSQASRPSW
jgi:hypothetical protein